MIRVTPLKTQKGKTTAQTAAGIVDYLKNEKESAAQATGYYSKNQAPSRWLGEGARALGLEGAVDDKRLYELLQGHLPDGTDLSARGGRAAQARLATDITISVQKSYSLMCVGDPSLLNLLDEGVEYVSKFIEKEVATARLKKGGTEVEHTGSMVMSAFRHEETRTVDGTADRDDHIHLIALNATQRADGTWARLDLSWGERMVLAKTADFALKAWLAQKVQERGHKIRITEDGWEFDSIAPVFIEMNSRRTGQRNAWLRAHGLDPETATDAQKTAASLATRGDKAQVGKIEQNYEWRARLREQGLDLDAINREARARGPIATPDLSLEAVRSAARHVGARESVFSKDITRLEGLKAGMGNVTLETVESAMTDKSAGLLDVGGGKITTRETLYREQEILARIRAGHGKVAPLLDAEEVAALIETTERDHGYPLSQGQRDAVTLALTTTDRVIGIVGVWGSGKTTGAVAPIVAAAKAQGFHTIGIAPTTKATKEVAGAKADETMTVAAWLLTKPEITTAGAIERDENRLIVMDEAAMVDAATMDKVLKKLDAEGGRLVMVGDPQQLPSVGAGRPMQQAIETQTLAVVKITEVQRQTDPRLKEMAEKWGRRDLVGAVQIAQEYMSEVSATDADYAEAKLLQEKAIEAKAEAEGQEATPTRKMAELAEKLGMGGAADRTFREVREYLDTHTSTVLGFEQRENDKALEQRKAAPRAVRQAAIVRQVAAEYLALTPEQRADTVMMTSTNHLRVRVNEKVRAGLQAEGALEGPDRTFHAIERTKMTDELLSRPESYRAGLIVRMPQGRGKDRQIVDFKVSRVEHNRVILEGPDGKEKSWNPATARMPQVYEQRDIPLAIGDELNFRDSAGLHGAPDRVKNGEDAKVIGFTPSGAARLKMEDGREIQIAPDAHHPLDHGYCKTVNGSQGATRGRAIYGVEGVSDKQALANLGGVATSREKSHLTIFTDDIKKTSAGLERWAEHKTAMEVAQAAHQPDLATLQKLRAEAQADLGRTGDLARAREDAEAQAEERPAQEPQQAQQRGGRDQEEELER